MLTGFLPHGSKARHALRRVVFEGLCAASKVSSWSRSNPPPPAGSRPSQIVGGDLRGLHLAHPVNHTSPSFALGWFERHVTDAIRRFVRSESTVYDVGANVGYHTLRLAKAVGNAGRVIAFEPSPVDRGILHWNLATNDIHNVEVDARAVSDRNGSLHLATFDEPGIHRLVSGDVPDDAKLIEVQATSLDRLVYDEGAPAPSFIKVDVEGSELAVLRGSQRLLGDARPVLVVEVWSKWRRELEEFMQSLDYELRPLSYHAGLSDVLCLPRGPREAER